MIVLGGEEDMEVEEKEDGVEAVLHFTSNILLQDITNYTFYTFSQ